MFPMLGDGIFTQEGATWKRTRELVRPLFAHREYEDLGFLRAAVDNLIAAIAAETRGGIVDLQPLLYRLTLDTTTAFLFGESVESLKAPDSAGEQRFAAAFDFAQECVAKRFRLLDLYWLIGGKEFQHSCKVVQNFAAQIIERNFPQGSASEHRIHRYVFSKSFAERIPDKDALRGHAVNMLAAGRDTTACLLAWTLYVTTSICASLFLTSKAASL